MLFPLQGNQRPSIFRRMRLVAAAWWGLALLLLVLLRGPHPVRILFAPFNHTMLNSTSNQTKAMKPTSPPRVLLTREVYVGGHRVAHPELCGELGAGLALLVLVTSAPDHTAERDAVRRTWGNLARRRDVALAFVIGLPSKRHRKNLAREDALYGDVIQGNWVDSYSNLTLKTLSMLEWCDTYCPRTPWLLKADDDVFFNIPRLLRFLASPHVANATRTIWGELRKGGIYVQAKRDRRSKWYLSKVQYPSDMFPPYVSGPGYVMTSDCVRPLLRAAVSRPYIRLEDAFITGVLADTLGIKRQGTREFSRISMKTAAEPCAVQRNMLVHMVSHRKQFELWRRLHDAAANCT